MNRKGKVLVLDDDVLTGKTIQKIAEFNDYDARLATEPEIFFSLYSEWKPDYIAMDLIMPKMDGMQIIDELARLKCTSAIIITSGIGKRVLDAAMRSAQGHGLHVLGVLSKPFNTAALKQLLEQFVPISANNPGEPLQADDSAVELAVAHDSLTPADLSRGIKRHEFIAAYQPKVAANSGVLTGFEILVRWQHPVRGMVGPDNFIPLAEQCGLIDELTLEVLNEALAWFSRLSASGQKLQALHEHSQTLSLSINISAVNLDNPALFDQLFDICAHWQIDPGQLIFELTESSAMANPVTALTILTRLRMKGFRLSIDDFGTGYSSMLQLVRLPFSEIKVDKSFVMTATESSESRAVIKSIIELGHSLGLQVTAEGIENELTVEYLRSQGCDLLQGYFIAPPLLGDEVIRWLEQRHPHQEEQRLAALYATRLLDTQPEERFDSLIALARRLFAVPMAFFCLVDKDRLWMKSRSGIGAQELPRAGSFTDHTIQGSGITLVPDAQLDERFAHLPLVTDGPRIRFYMGCPIRTSDGSRIGAISLVDTVPREYTHDQVDVFLKFGHLLERELEKQADGLRDDVTQILNGKGFESSASTALEMCVRLGKSSGLMIFDVEENNSGHVAAESLAAFSSVLRNSLRRSDVISRFAPENRFVVYLINITNKTAGKVLRRIARTVGEYQENQQLPASFQYSTRVSTSHPGQQENLQSLLSRAELG
jgi:EAL domain-containing protein (putative c-di-GMP-specific phosphodiesterase class I)/PleD family two-component response regulator